MSPVKRPPDVAAPGGPGCLSTVLTVNVGFNERDVAECHLLALKAAGDEAQAIEDGPAVSVQSFNAHGQIPFFPKSGISSLRSSLSAGLGTIASTRRPSMRLPW